MRAVPGTGSLHGIMQTTSPTTSEWMTLSDAAARAGVAHRTMRGWADRGLVECFRTPGGHRRIDARSLERLLAARRDGTSQPARARSSVLVVEDDPTARGIVRAELERAGFDVTEAASALQGLHAINESVPEMLVLDVHLPGMDGWEMLRRVRTRLDAASLPVIVYSGRVTVRPGREAGRVIHRPFDPGHIVSQAAALAAVPA